MTNPFVPLDNDRPGIWRIRLPEHSRPESDPDDLERRDLSKKHRPMQSLFPDGLESDGGKWTSSFQHDRHLA
jgi:hypothetical protein